MTEGTILLGYSASRIFLEHSPCSVPSISPLSPQNSLSEEIANMKKLQDELLLNKVRAWDLTGSREGGLPLIAAAAAPLRPLPPLHRSSSWRRWNGCRWRSTSSGGGRPPPIPGDRSALAPPFLSGTHSFLSAPSPQLLVPY